jgi:hypothetical protein
MNDNTQENNSWKKYFYLHNAVGAKLSMKV